MSSLAPVRHDPGGRSKPAWPKGSKIVAWVSSDDLYRWELIETWDATRPMVNFLMMNPSVAGVAHADPTLIRTGTFARSWGYGAQTITNMHPYRITDSKLLAEVPYPVGAENDARILSAARRSHVTVLAYGLPPKPLRARAIKVVCMLQSAGVKLTYLRLSKDGTPQHPLYLPGNLTPLEYRP